MVLDASCHKEAKIERIAKLVVASYGYDELRRYVVNKKHLLQDVKRYGVNRLKGSGYVIHHINPDLTSHFIETGRKAEEYSYLLKILKNRELEDKYNSESHNTNEASLKNYKGNISDLDQYQLYCALQDEMNNVMLLPEWFHNYLHDSGKSYSSSDEYYQALEDCIKDNYRYTTDDSGKLVEREIDADKIVDSIQFHDKTISSALESILNLVIMQNNRNKNGIIKDLQDIYDRLYAKLINDLKHLH